MNIVIHERNCTMIAEITDPEFKICTVQDALDLMVNMPARKIALKRENLSASFFDLKSGLAGEILQKFTNYNVDLAVIGDFSNEKSKSLRDFIYESNKTNRIIFVDSMEEVLKRFGQ